MTRSVCALMAMVAVAATASAQTPRLSNGTIQPHQTTNIARDLPALAATLAEPMWIGYAQPLIEGEEPVIHTAKKPEPEIPQKVKVPDFAHRLPKEIQRFTTKGVYGEGEDHLSFTQGGGHGGSHPHLANEFIQALLAKRDDFARQDTASGHPDELSEKVQAALLKLSPKERAAIILTVYDEMNHAAAARVLGCSEVTVSWRVHMARKKLKRWLRVTE